MKKSKYCVIILMLTIEPLYTYYSLLNLKKGAIIMEQEIKSIESKQTSYQLAREIQEYVSVMNRKDFKLTSISCYTYNSTFNAMLVFSKE